MAPLASWLTKPLGQARSLATTRLFLETNHDRSRSVLLAGCERSGTTWLAQLLCADGTARLLFEPLRPDVHPGMNLNLRPYLRPDGTYPEMEVLMDRIVEGRLRHPHCDHINTVLFPRRRVVKFVHANLLLGWLRRRYPELPILLLVRHPFSVALSRDKKGWNWFPGISTAMLNQPELCADHLDVVRPLFANVRSTFARNVLIWCVEYAVPFRQLRSGDLHIVFYEHLAARPEPVLREVFSYADLPRVERALDRVTEKSPTSRPGSTLILAGREEALRQGVAPGDLDEALEVLDAFDLLRVYDDGPLPKTEHPLAEPENGIDGDRVSG